MVKSKPVLSLSMLAFSFHRPLSLITHRADVAADVARAVAPKILVDDCEKGASAIKKVPGS